MTMPSRHIALLQLIYLQNSITQLNPSHYVMAVIQTSSIEGRGPTYTDTKNVNSLLALIMKLESCSLFTPDFIIPAVTPSHQKCS